MENIFNDHLLDWLILATLIGGAYYTMRVIRRESSTMKDEAVAVPFQGLVLNVPRWWTQTLTTSDTIQFERTDTRYDWYARFAWMNSEDSLPLHDFLQRKVELDELDYDRDDVTLETNPLVLFRRERESGAIREVIRVEGKASQQIENRVYLDLVFFRVRGRPGHYMFESRSSVLNGLVEGPYFEEVLAELEVSTLRT